MREPNNAGSAGIGENQLEDLQSPRQIEARVERSQNESGLFSTESVLDILKLIFAGSPLPEVLTIIARLFESQGDGLFCTIWLLDEDGKHLHCATAPSLPGFIAQIGRAEVCAKGASCGTAVYRKEPVYVTDILTDPIWENYRDRVLPYGIRSAWSRPLFTREGKSLGAFSIHSREPRNPSATDLQLIENASHITGIGIERHLNEEQLRRTEAYLTEAERLSHSGSFVWDVHRPGPSYWSAEMCRIHGRDPSQGPPLFEEDRSLQSTEDWAGLMAAAEKSMREKTDIDYDSQLFFPDGSTKNIRIVAHPVVNSDGDVVQFVGTTIDVTEQHRAKAALESALTEITKSEVRLRTIIDTIPAMAWCALPDGFAEFHNQRWLDYTGLSDEEARG
jgi:PAS domain-containing protein